MQFNNLQFIWSVFSILTQYFQELYARYITTNICKNNHYTHNNHQPLSSKSIYTKTHIISHAIEYINQNYNKNITVADISSFCCCSQSYISHNFKESLGMSIPAYINKVRIEHSKALLKNEALPISYIATEVGFNDPNYFSTVFSEYCGISPRNYKVHVKVQV